MVCVHISSIIVQEGISFEDVQAFTELVENISDVEMALSMYMAAGASITPGILYTHTLSFSAFFLSSSLLYTLSQLSLSMSFFFHRPWYIYLINLSLCLLASPLSPGTHLTLPFRFVAPGTPLSAFPHQSWCNICLICIMCGYTLCKERERRYTRSDGKMQREVYQGR